MGYVRKYITQLENDCRRLNSENNNKEQFIYVVAPDSIISFDRYKRELSSMFCNKLHDRASIERCVCDHLSIGQDPNGSYSLLKLNIAKEDESSYWFSVSDD